ncbi:MAG: IPT/TIG domain-containing protein, partial [Undibacterium umbellatum]|uniref:IPT/TIG domain-containing protein n=1 Tax=Undibacterium umbellatum TaxID=2762300 RepID=UPI003BB80DC6
MTMQHRFCLKHGLVDLLAIVLAAWSVFIRLFSVRPCRALLLLAFFLGTHLASPALAADVQYVYDKLGRLVNVVAADGSSVQYTYDAVGNIQGIQKNATTALAIAEFSPSSGSAGTAVTIFGSGFDTVVANNIVKFNGKPATVTVATANSLTASAPVDVATGKITISNTNGLATSSADFVVGVAAAPTITGFTPIMGSSGTVVTVTGSNYQLNKTDNKVSFGNSFAAVSSVTSSSLLTSPPASPVSGKISISTPYGQAISSSDFYGLPMGVSSADIGYAGRLSVNAPATKVSTSTAGKKAVLLFEGVGQQYLSLLSTAGTFAANVNVAVYRPDGNLLVTGVITNTDNFELPKLPISGTYTILLTPGSSDKGDLNLSLMPAGTMNIDAVTPLSVVAGQVQRFTFTAEAGKTFGLSLTDLKFIGTASGTKNVKVYLERGDGTAIYDWTFTQDGSCDLYVPQWFATTGTYVLRFVPAFPFAASFNAILSKDIEAGILLPGAVPIKLTTIFPGQNGRYTFNATTGQSFNLAITGNTMPVSSSKTVWIYKPSSGGSEWASLYLDSAP